MAGPTQLRFENDSPEGDRSIFIDSISVALTANALAVVLPVSSAEAQPYDFQLISTLMSFSDAEAECDRRNRICRNQRDDMQVRSDTVDHVFGATDASAGTESWLRSIAWRRTRTSPPCTTRCEAHLSSTSHCITARQG